MYNLSKQDYMNPGILEITTNANTTLRVDQQNVRIRSDGTGNFTVTLPNVSEAIGRLYSINLVARSGTDVITIAAGAEAEDWTNITTMDATNDAVLLYSDGVRWYVVADEIA